MESLGSVLTSMSGWAWVVFAPALFFFAAAAWRGLRDLLQGVAWRAQDGRTGRAIERSLFGLTARGRPGRASTPRAALIQMTGAAARGSQIVAVQSDRCWRVQFDVPQREGAACVAEFADDPDLMAQRSLVEQLVARLDVVLRDETLILEPFSTDLRMRLIAARRHCGRERCEIVEFGLTARPQPCTLAMRFAPYLPKPASEGDAEAPSRAEEGRWTP